MITGRAVQGRKNRDPQAIVGRGEPWLRGVEDGWVRCEELEKGTLQRTVTYCFWLLLQNTVSRVAPSRMHTIQTSCQRIGKKEKKKRTMYSE